MKQIIERCLIIYQTSGIAGLFNLITELRAERKRMDKEIEELKRGTAELEAINESLRKTLKK